MDTAAALKKTLIPITPLSLSSPGDVGTLGGIASGIHIVTRAAAESLMTRLLSRWDAVTTEPGAGATADTASIAVHALGPPLRPVGSEADTSASARVSATSYVSPIQLAWMDLHHRMGWSEEIEGGIEALASEHEGLESAALLGGVSTASVRRVIGVPMTSSGLGRALAA
jgi:hypothetical protein